MKTGKLFLSFILALLIVYTLVEGMREKKTFFSGKKFTIHYTITVAETLDATQKKHIEETIEHIFLQVDTTFNRWNPQSELSSVNKTRSLEPIPLSPLLYQFLLSVEELVTLSSGLFDPTIYPLQKLWKTHLEQEAVPDKKAILSLTHAIGWNKISLEEGYLLKKDPRVEIDLDGVVKGYTVDLLSKELFSLGYHDTLVEWGGEMRAQGKPSSHSLWTIFIDAFGKGDREQALKTITLDNASIATSGDYFQIWPIVENGKVKNYTHILRGKSGTPLEVSSNYFRSATVIAPDCYQADALATTLLLFEDFEEAKEFMEKISTSCPEISLFYATGK